MAERVCPWWAGYLLASPIRRWISDSPEEMLQPFVHEGSLVLEPGPGMGYFTLPLARMVAPAGCVYAVDIQPKMLQVLDRKAASRELASIIQTRLADVDHMNIEDLEGRIDFTLAFAVVHEMPDPKSFFRQVAAALKPGGILFFAEPSGHVKLNQFEQELEAARAAGLEVSDRRKVRRCHAAVLTKTAA